ncbi:hypothetical protein [Actinospongicola halichondriae]|uniref:hypothetical protein n=1 Tax=Actinospongicola halichondriae TaxID=3236844 RepID=UPI003D5CD1FB
MGLFRRKDIIDLTDDAMALSSEAEATPSTTEASLHAGVPGRCPTCDGFGYIDHIDMVHRYQRQHCRTCGHVWEFTFDEAGDVLDLTDIEAGSLDNQDFGIQI